MREKRYKAQEENRQRTLTVSLKQIQIAFNYKKNVQLQIYVKCKSKLHWKTVPQTRKHRHAMSPKQFHSYIHIPKRNTNICLHKNIHMNVCSRFILNGQMVETSHMSTSEWMDKQKGILLDQRMECYLVTKRNEILIHAMTQMNFENMLNKRSQLQRPHLYDTIYMKCPKQAILWRGSRLMLTQGWEKNELGWW